MVLDPSPPPLVRNMRTIFVRVCTYVYMCVCCLGIRVSAGTESCHMYTYVHMRTKIVRILRTNNVLSVTGALFSCAYVHTYTCVCNFSYIMRSHELYHINCTNLSSEYHELCPDTRPDARTMYCPSHADYFRAHMYIRIHVCVCACVRVRVRGRLRAHVCVYLYVCVFVRTILLSVYMIVELLTVSRQNELMPSLTSADVTCICVT